MIKVSVIVPVFNMEKYIKECLDSILCQSLKEIEVITVNDGSTDSSLEILRDYRNRDERIVIIDKENAGVGAARNDGIKAARGEFVSFMDPDDMFAGNDALRCCYETAKREGVPVSGGRLVLLYEDGRTEIETEKKIGAEFVRVSGLVEYKDYQYDYGYTCFIYDRQMLIDNDVFFPLYSRFQDPPFFVKAMVAAERLYISEEPFYVYRQLFGQAKYTFVKTADFLKGIMDDLKISRENDLAKLHYITAYRLNKEGSFMVTKNLFGERRNELLFSMIRASSMVDAEWLRDNGYTDMYPYVPEVFEYAADTAEKYEKLRNNKLLKGILNIAKTIKK